MEESAHPKCLAILSPGTSPSTHWLRGCHGTGTGNAIMISETYKYNWGFRNMTSM